MADPPAPLTYFPGGSIRLDPKIPTAIGPNPIGPAHRAIAAALIDRGAAPPWFFFRTVGAATAATLIEGAFEQEIARILEPANPEWVPLTVSILLSEDAKNVDVLINPSNYGIYLPSWLNEPTIDDATKSAMYQALTKALAIILPFGTLPELITQFADYQWNGATTDEDVRSFLIEEYEIKPEDIGHLPSDFAAATPNWAKPGDQKPASAFSPKIDALNQTAADFKKRNPPTDAWNSQFDAAIEIEPMYEDSYAIPSLWIIPEDQIFTDALDEIARPGMETMFYDVCGAARLSNARQISQWLDDLAAGIAFMVKLEQFFNLDSRCSTP